MSTGTPRRAAAVVTALLAACLCTGCDESPPATLPHGLDATLVQLRSDVADRRAQVRIRNDGDRTVTVGEVTVTDPRFEPAATRVVERTTELPPGAAVDIRVALGEALCDAPATGAATVTLALRTEGGSETATAPVPELFPFLEALHTAECLRARVDAVADIGIQGFEPSPAGEAATLRIRAAERDADAAELVIIGVRDTNLLTVDDALPPSVVEGEQTLAVPLVPARCDPHAVQEDKRGTVFRVDVELDGTPGSFDLAASPDTRARMLNWVADWCGYGPGA
ncbi:hypothetical protein [Microbacterium sp. GXF7504]